MRIRVRPTAGAMGILSIVAALSLLVVFAPGCLNARAEHSQVSIDGDVVHVDSWAIEKGSGTFFAYRTAAGGMVKFLVYRDSLGTPRVVLDACRSCYRWRQGYAFEGDYLTCRKCGERFDIDGFEGGRASCAPIPLPVILERGELRIPVRELELAQVYF